MPILANPRWEKFAQFVASGESGAPAYRKTYDARGASAEANASRLLRNDKVKQRVAELQAGSATAATLTMRQRRQIACTIARDATAKASDRLAAIIADARLAGELKGDSLIVSATATANAHVLTEERRAELMEKRRRAMEWVSS